LIAAPGTAQVFVGQVEKILVVGVGVHRRHEAGFYAEASSRTFTIGTKQFVVHEAFEMTRSVAGSKESSLTPITKVASASPEGAEMMTRFAPRPSGRSPPRAR